MRTRMRTMRRNTLRMTRLSYMRRKMTSCLRSQGRVKKRMMTRRKMMRTMMMPQLTLRLGKGRTDPGE
jgi:hypothetical protein